MIRNARKEDAKVIRGLLEQLGYPQSEEFIRNKLVRLMESYNDDVYVYEYHGQVLAVISLHYSIQLVYEKDFCEIGYFVVDQNARGQNIGDKLEQYACQRARERNCCFMLVFSSLKRKDAHRFYERQGYAYVEKYFEKEL